MVDVPTTVRPLVLQGHVVDRLRELPEGSVQTVVTSPPYWALRAYKTEPQVWGGNAKCEHHWDAEEWVRPYAGGNRSVPVEWQREGRRESAFVEKNWENSTPGGGTPEGQASARVERSAGSFCSECTAWRGELGLEPTPELYVDHLVAVFQEIRRVLRNDGTVFLDIGDSYWGGETHPILKPKDLCLIPEQLAIALQADGWWVRSDIVWHKRNAMPEPVKDRPGRSHEYIWLLSKSRNYFYDQDGYRTPNVRECDENNGGSISTGRQVEAGGSMGGMESHPKGYPLPNPLGANARTVWSMATQPYPDAHFATFPEELPRRAILLGTSEYGACVRCGSPYERIRETKFYGDAVSDGYDIRDQTGRSAWRSSVQAGYEPPKTVGWWATCKCGAQGVIDFRPCVVLDPFAGSGTTLAVARSLGRASIGIELNPKYVEQIQKRPGTTGVSLEDKW